MEDVCLQLGYNPNAPSHGASQLAPLPGLLFAFLFTLPVYLSRYLQKHISGWEEGSKNQQEKLDDLGNEAGNGNI